MADAHDKRTRSYDMSQIKAANTKPCSVHAPYKFIKQQLIKLFGTKTIQHLADEITNGAGFTGNKK